MKPFLTVLFIVLGSSVAQTSLNMGYTPSLSASQLFVSVGEGSFEFRLREFQTDAATVQALVAGELDAAYVDVGSALEARKNIGIKIVAASTLEQISFVAQGDLAQYFTPDRTVPQAFQRFIDMEGKRAQIATSPVGTVSETALRMWLDASGVPAEAVEILYMNPAQLRGALEARAVTAAAVTQAQTGAALDALESAQILASEAEAFASSPAGVLVVRDELIVEQAEVVQALVDAHIRATELLTTDPERAAESVQAFVDEPTLTALGTLQDTFVADPDAARAGAQLMQDIHIAMGTLEKEIFLDELFDTRFFNASQD